MIISVENAKRLLNLEGWTDEKIRMKLDAIEQTIRAYTNNNFQNRAIRSNCSVIDGLLYGVTVGFSVGDTVQISESKYNGGLHTIIAIDEERESIEIEGLNENEFPVLLTKIEYPADVIDCCVNLMEWELKGREKVGIKSETLSRHSVTYEDSASMFRGYPKGILSAVGHYRKARC